MKNTGETFVKNQNTYGVHALLMTGIAANESNWGKSSISQKKNNLFGLNATDAAPGANAISTAVWRPVLKTLPMAGCPEDIFIREITGIRVVSGK